jgi:hypothetical protein
VGTVAAVLVFVIAIVVAIVVVIATGGSLLRIAELPVARIWMLLAGLALQIALETDLVSPSRYDDVGLALLLASYVLILGFCLSNLRVTGLGVIAIGIALNASVIALNGGMPYRAPEDTKPETTVKHRPERAGDVLTALDDRIVLPSPFDASISFGDLILAVGLVDAAYHGSRRSRRSRARGARADRARDSDDAAAASRGHAPGASDGGADSLVDDAVERGEHPDVVHVAGT